MFGQGGDGGQQGVVDVSGGAPVGQVQQHHVASGPFDEGPDRGLADDQVAFQYPGTARSSASAGRSLIMTIG